MQSNKEKVQKEIASTVRGKAQEERKKNSQIESVDQVRFAPFL